MLYQFTFKNFKSYKDETVFDMRAENIKEFEESLLIDKNEETLLPVSVIYGPNAGGKSGLLEALVCLITIVLKPKRMLEKNDYRKNNRTFAFYNNIKPYKFDDESINKPTEFEIYFSTENNEYRYNLSIFENKIINESLYKKEFKAKKPAKIFERNKNSIDLGEMLKKLNISKNVNENMPYLTYISITNNINVINDVMNWFENITAMNYAKDFERNITILEGESKELLLAIMEGIDIDICDYRTEEKEDDEKKFKDKYLKNYAKISFVEHKSLIKNINKLLEKGYSNSDVSIILTHGSEEDVISFTERERVRYLEEFLNFPYAKIKYYDRYIAYTDETGEDEKTTVIHVNLNMDKKEYERDRAEKKLLMKLQEAEEAVKDGEGWLDLDELKALVGE